MINLCVLTMSLFIMGLFFTVGLFHPQGRVIWCILSSRSEDSLWSLVQIFYCSRYIARMNMDIWSAYLQKLTGVGILCGFKYDDIASLSWTFIWLTDYSDLEVISLKELSNYVVPSMGAVQFRFHWMLKGLDLISYYVLLNIL